VLWTGLEVIGTVAFAAAGALVGVKKRLDIFGVAMLAVTTAVGGGIMRDTLIGNIPPLAFRNPMFIFISLAVAGLVSIYVKQVARQQRLLNFCDALGLGAFTATGASLALSHDSALLVITVGVVTGTGGGVLRDIFVREIPLVFHTEIYAVAAAIGAACFYGLQKLLPVDMALYLACLITVAIRLLSLYYGINLPRVRADKLPDDKHRGRPE
jgi:uncharacterized membrane protein YeiH